MGNQTSTDLDIKNGYEAHKYYLETTSRSVVIELHNNTKKDFKKQDYLIIHGDDLLIQLPDFLQKESINYICHGSNGVMTGVQAWITYLSSDGNLLKISWECAYIGASFVNIETQNYIITQTELETSRENNLYIKIELKEIKMRKSSKEIWDFINGD